MLADKLWALYANKLAKGCTPRLRCFTTLSAQLSPPSTAAKGLPHEEELSISPRTLICAAIENQLKIYNLYIPPLMFSSR